MFGGGGLTVSKKELEKLLPKFWSDLKTGNMLSLPSSRESLNGNFFDGILYDPVITLEGDNAKAAVTFVTPTIRWKTTMFLNFQKYQGAWLINRLEWALG